MAEANSETRSDDRLVVVPPMLLSPQAGERTAHLKPGASLFQRQALSENTFLRLGLLFAGHFLVREPLPRDLPEHRGKALPIVHVFAVVVAERLFVDVAAQVE